MRTAYQRFSPKKTASNALAQKQDWASPQAFKQCFAEQEASFFMWGEFGSKMQKLNSPQFGDTKGWLTDRYGSFSIPDTVVHRKREYDDNGDANTKLVKTANISDIVFLHAPRMNILASSSYRWFYDNVQESDSFGGFIPRWMLWNLDAQDRDVPWSGDVVTPKGLKENLQLWLRKAAKLPQKSHADFSVVHDPYIPWYNATKARFLRQPNASLAKTFWDRHRIHTLMLAVIFEFSMSCTLKVSLRSWERAVETAKTLETTIFKMLRTGMDKDGYDRQEVLTYVHDAGVNGCSWNTVSELFGRKFKNGELRRLAVEYDECQKIVCFKHFGKGPPTKMLVDFEFLEQYKAAFPKDAMVPLASVFRAN